MNVDPNDDTFEAELFRFLTDRPFWFSVGFTTLVALWALSL